MGAVPLIAVRRGRDVSSFMSWSRNPKGPAEGTRKVIRGSGWGSEGSLLRSAHRRSSDPTNCIHSVEVYCAADAR
jgi:hypothetical protein